MHFEETIGLLLAVTLGAIVLRAYWDRIPHGVEKALFVAGAIVVAIRFLFLVTRWGMASSRMNAILCWLAVIAYELILVRFSLMRPRWLTSLCAVVLLLPMFASSLLLPLTKIFDAPTANRIAIAMNYELEREPWDAKINGRSGYDFGILYRPSWIPLQRMAQRSSFSDEQCRAIEATASVDTQKHLVHFHCPGHHGQASDIDLALPLK